MFIKIKVHPDSKQTKVLRKAADSFEIWIREPAERGLANSAALQALGTALEMNPARLKIIKGSRTPNKIVRILGQ